MSHCSQTKITENHLKHQRWPTKDFEQTHHCDTKNTGTCRNTNKSKQKREWQRTITPIKRALKAEESHTEWLSSHSVAIQQADERMSHCSQTKITEHHLKHQRWPTKDLERAYHCNTKTTGRNTNTSNKMGVAKNHQINKTCSKSRGISDWVAIKPQYRDPAGRWAHVTLQSNENYRTSSQTSTMTNQGFRTNTPLWYQEHGDRKKQIVR